MSQNSVTPNVTRFPCARLAQRSSRSKVTIVTIVTRKREGGSPEGCK